MSYMELPTLHGLMLLFAPCITAPVSSNDRANIIFAAGDRRSWWNSLDKVRDHAGNGVMFLNPESLAGVRIRSMEREKHYLEGALVARFALEGK